MAEHLIFKTERRAS